MGHRYQIHTSDEQRQNMVKKIQMVMNCFSLVMLCADSMGWVDPALAKSAEIGFMSAEIVLVPIERHLEEKEQ